MIEKKSIMTSGKQLDTIVYPSNKPHYCVPGCNFLWKAHGKFQSWKIKSKRKKLKKINHDLRKAAGHNSVPLKQTTLLCTWM